MPCRMRIVFYILLPRCGASRAVVACIGPGYVHARMDMSTLSSVYASAPDFVTKMAETFIYNIVRTRGQAVSTSTHRVQSICSHLNVSLGHLESSGAKVAPPAPIDHLIHISSIDPPHSRERARCAQQQLRPQWSARRPLPLQTHAHGLRPRARTPSGMCRSGRPP
jgi:hypothetical protein